MILLAASCAGGGGGRGGERLLGDDLKGAVGLGEHVVQVELGQVVHLDLALVAVDDGHVLLDAHVDGLDEAHEVLHLHVQRDLLEVAMIVDDDLEAHDHVLLVLLVHELIDEREHVAYDGQAVVDERARERAQHGRGALHDLERLLAQLVRERLGDELRFAVRQHEYELAHRVVDQLRIRRQHLHQLNNNSDEKDYKPKYFIEGTSR